MATRPKSPRRARAPAWIIGGVALAILLAAGGFGFTQWQEHQAQQQRIASLAEELRANRQMATRNRPLDLTAVRPEITAVSVNAPSRRPAPPRAGAADAQIGLLFGDGPAPQGVRAETASDLGLLVAAAVRGEMDVLLDPVVTDDPRNRLDLVGQQAAQSRLEQRLREAVEKDQIIVPTAFLATDGTVDMRLFVFDLLLRTLKTGSDAEKQTAQRLRSEIASSTVGETDPVTGLRRHTVADGDSLAYIALLHYGDPSGFASIRQANRNRLGTEGRIRPGDQLFVPMSPIIR